MRAPEFIFERATPLVSLKNKVKQQIDLTDDESLLNKIYSSLNKGTLLDRLSIGLSNLSDPEIQGFVAEIATVIEQAPGSYNEKMEFIKGLHAGFIDIDKMIDGQRHHFSDLLIPNKKVSLKFLFDMFNSLKDLGGRAKKGPGEFAIALMSPKVSVFGGGDLKIGNLNVEVKAEKGTIGGTGYFQHSKVPVILQQYFPGIDLSKNIGSKALSGLVKTANLDPKTLDEFANKLVDYIFKAQEGWANTTPLKNAIKNIGSPDQANEIMKGYLVAAYSAYKGREKGKSKFDGVMLMDYSKQELRYFDDPEELYSDIDTPQFNFFSTNKEWGGKLINPGVKLKTSPVDKVQVPAGKDKNAIQNFADQQADYLLRKAQQRNPRDLDLRDPVFKQDVVANLRNMIAQGLPTRKISSEILKKFPQLRLRDVGQV
jgi:hypothetical protein